MLITIGALIVLALGGVLWLSPLGRRLHKGHLAGATLLVAWSVGAGIKIYQDSSADDASALVSEARRVGAIAWQSGGATGDRAGGRTATTGAPAAPAAGVRNAAPVQSLIGGLEARLESNPDDAKGWALLAQSYAFVGDSAGAERAMQRAVALGMDATALRERVERATRATSQTPKGNWIEQAIGG